jgi:hypothetical protein
MTYNYNTYNNDWKPTEINEGQPVNWQPKPQTPEARAKMSKNSKWKRIE